METDPFQPIVSQRLYQQVADKIKRQIESGKWTAGTRLPSEKELAERLRVSRPTVREAMIALEIAGLVDIRSGAGSYVRQESMWRQPHIETGPGPFELLNARLLIEGEIAMQAAVRASGDDLARIGHTIEEMRAMLERREHTRSADRKFHVCVAQAAGNDVLATIVDSLWQGMFSPLFHKLSELTQLVARQERAIQEHEAIFKAISERNAAKAREAMRHHLGRVRDVLSERELMEAGASMGPAEGDSEREAAQAGGRANGAAPEMAAAGGVPSRKGKSGAGSSGARGSRRQGGRG